MGELGDRRHGTRREAGCCWTSVLGARLRRVANMGTHTIAERGIIPRMVKAFFDRISTQPEDIEFSMRVSFVEIYNEKIRDLLDPKKNNLKIHENKQ